MNILRISFVLVASVLLAGCGAATAPLRTHDYDNDHSRAYNISYAASIITGLSDTTKPRNQVLGVGDNAAFGAAYTMAGFGSGVTGISGLSGGAINFLNWYSIPDTDAARTSFFAWMPETEALNREEAYRKMKSHVKTAISKAATSLGAKVEFFHSEDGTDFFNIRNNRWGCNAVWEEGKTLSKDFCMIAVKLHQPREAGPTPAYIAGYTPRSYAFPGGIPMYPNFIKIVRKGDNSSLPQDQFYTELSKALPEWSYLYLAPKTVEIEAGKKIQFPVLLENGEPLYFVYPN